MFIKKTTKYTCLIFLLLLFACSSDNNDVKETGFKAELDVVFTFGGSNDDTATDIIKTSDGGFAVLGNTSSIDGDITDKTTIENDYWFLKFDSQGNLEWNKTYGGSKDDLAQALIETNDGGYAIAGYSMSSDGDASVNNGYHDNWVIRLNASGEIIWEKSFGYEGHDHAYDIIQTNEGDFLISGFLDVTVSGGEGNTGRSSVTGHGVGEFWATLLNANGEIKWQRYFGGSNNDRAHTVVQANDGNFLLAGFTESADFDISATNGSYDFWVLKVSNKGEKLWERTYGGTGIERANAIEKTADNGFIIVGGSNSNDGMKKTALGGNDVWAIKINDTGKLLWEKSYGGSDFDDATSITATNDGGFIITGNSKSLNNQLTENQGENDIWVFKVNSSGDLIWQKSIGTSGLDFGFGAFQNDTGDFVYACGEVIATESGSKELAVIRLK